MKKYSTQIGIVILALLAFDVSAAGDKKRQADNSLESTQTKRTRRASGADVETVDLTGETNNQPVAHVDLTADSEEESSEEQGISIEEFEQMLAATADNIARDLGQQPTPDQNQPEQEPTSAQNQNVQQPTPDQNQPEQEPVVSGNYPALVNLSDKLSPEDIIKRKGQEQHVKQSSSSRYPGEGRSVTPQDIMGEGFVPHAQANNAPQSVPVMHPAIAKLKALKGELEKDYNVPYYLQLGEYIQKHMFSVSKLNQFGQLLAFVNLQKECARTYKRILKLDYDQAGLYLELCARLLSKEKFSDEEKQELLVFLSAPGRINRFKEKGERCFNQLVSEFKKRIATSKEKAEQRKLKRAEKRKREKEAAAVSVAMTAHQERNKKTQKKAPKKQSRKQSATKEKTATVSVTTTVQEKVCDAAHETVVESLISLGESSAPQASLDILATQAIAQGNGHQATQTQEPVTPPFALTTLLSMKGASVQVNVSSASAQSQTSGEKGNGKDVIDLASDSDSEKDEMLLLAIKRSLHDRARAKKKNKPKRKRGKQEEGEESDDELAKIEKDDLQEAIRRSLYDVRRK